MENSKIEWTTHSFNPWIGCEKTSPGCAHCYAKSLVERFGNNFGIRRRTSKAYWNVPLKWNKSARGAAERPRVFCASLADWLDDKSPIEWLADLLELIDATPNLDWLLLTKRPQNFASRMREIVALADRPARRIARNWASFGIIPPNVWIGVSAEDQFRWNERMPLLLSIPARIRFVSAEPLLGRIHMGELRPDWLIVGGESGSGARPMEREWVEDLRDQCDDRTAFLFKQWGGVKKQETGRILDGRTWDEFPRV